MIPALSLRTDGLFDTSKLQAWTNDHQRRIRAGVKKAFQEGGRELAQAINAEVAQKLKVKRRAFPSFRVKVYDQRPDRLPALLVYSKIPWLGIFTRGGTVTAKGRGLLIPLTEEGRRLGPKAFRRIVTGLMRQGNAFFKEVNGKILLFAENIAESGQYLSRFRKSYRQRAGLARGTKLKRGVEIPIAVLVPSVTLRKQFDPVESLRRYLPRIVSKIEQYISVR